MAMIDEAKRLLLISNSTLHGRGYLAYKRWAKNPQLNAFVRGVTAAATGAIAGAVVVLARRSVYDLPTVLICAASLAVLFRRKIPEPVLIACAAMAGLALRHT